MKKLILWLVTAVTFVGSAHAQLGSATTDLVYTPVTPCRVLDTRPTFGGSGPIATGGVKSFAVSGVASYSSQGGSPTNCGMAAVGANARAIAIYLTVVTPTVGGWITAYENGVTAPAAATVNFKAGDVLGNTTIVPVTPGTAGLAGNSYMNIFASSATNVVGDIVGYYSKPVSAGSLQCSVIVNNVDIAAGLRHFGETPFCPAGTLALAGGVICSGNADQTLNAVDPTAGQESFFVSLTNNSAATKSCRFHTKCCSIPGR